ncbi:MAG: hypothetical protein RI968_874 [Pseudomonadota bacterium]
MAVLEYALFIHFGDILLPYALAVLLSSFLLFLVQPIIAKQIVPWFGGSASVWSACLSFFQLVLLAGYAYSDVVQKIAARRQSMLHTALLIASLISLPILASADWKPSGDEVPLLRILGLLALTVGLPYFMLSTTGPLIQSWFAREQLSPERAQRAYRLFALSNFGSLLGLVAYPFVIEPFVGIEEQAWIWSALYVAFVAVVIWVGLRAVGRASIATAKPFPTPPCAGARPLTPSSSARSADPSGKTCRPRSNRNAPPSCRCGSTSPCSPTSGRACSTGS